MVSKGFNHLGEPIELCSPRTQSDIQFSDLELLVFYYNLIKDGTLPIGGAGFKRMTQVKSRVYKREQEMVKNNPAILKSVKRRKFISKLLKAGTEFE